MDAQCPYETNVTASRSQVIDDGIVRLLLAVLCELQALHVFLLAVAAYDYATASVMPPEGTWPRTQALDITLGLQNA